MKEKLICALKSNLEEIKPCFYWSSKGMCSAFKFKNIVLFSETLDVGQQVSKGKYFWQRKVKPLFKSIFQIHYYNTKIDITEEEYDEILFLREKAIKEKQLKELDELCKQELILNK
jgi:hypothetical protein